MHFKLYLLHQKQEIEKYKWLKGQELGYDPGEKAVKEWIEKYAEQYREEHNQVYEQAIHETSQECVDKLKKKVPGVSDDLWNYIFEEIIDTFTDVWLKDVCCAEDDREKKHLEEI